MLLLPIVPEHRVKVSAVSLKPGGEVSDLCHPSGQVDERFVKTLVLRPAGIIVTQMPFAKDTGGITTCTKHFCDGDFLCGHDGAAIVGVPDSSAQGIPAGHQTGAGRRTDR